MEGTLNNEGNEALITEMLRDTQKAEVAGELEKNPVIHKGDSEMPAPMVVNTISSAGYVWAWDTRTGEKIPVIHYMLPATLRKRRDDGSYRFTTVDPKITPKGIKVKCMLHKDSPNRQHYDDIGFHVCNKENIINAYQLKQHMRRKHPQEWAAIEEERQQGEREEDRALQRLLIEKSTGGIVEKPPVYVSDKPTVAKKK